jgi:4-hydroxy-2-oxoglutarate aldolase
MTIKLSGLFLPVPTPFTTNESIDDAGLKSNIERWNGMGLSGYVVLGSTGERVNLDEHEYLEIIEITRRRLPESMTFIVGAGQQSTRASIKEIERAASAGAHVALVITPNFYRAAITQAALLDHYRAIGDAAKIPILLYSMPDLTGIKIEPETAAQLSEHENIIGIKDSSNDIEKLRETVRVCRHDFAVMIGNGTVFADALSAGARGGILAVGCCAPEVCLAIYQAFQAHDEARANDLQTRLTPLARAVTRTYGIGGLKVAMEMAGFTGGAVRAPLRRPGEEARAEIEAFLRLATSASVPGAVATGS